ncbi:Ig-like domain (group 2) [Halpernia humi]|uniref:Ig-like domain (Group 2) n=1 Tax=Halpernia humi TaxID=493375 RepID=A0A1H5U8Y7_9FLAO|nr:Ig-like domain-containing protein [Halpernia humi]SEF71585.1 Ig-like domain (group 2) [Halpernia humi]
MKSQFNIYKFTKVLLSCSAILMIGSCQRDLNELQQATNPVNGDVFIDGFSPGLQYAAFGGSVPDAFDTDKNTTYNNSAQSMKFAVPDVNDPNGSYAGGAFFTSTPRDLSSFNTLSFWIKATQPANIDVIGFGTDLGENKYQASLSALPVNTNWKKVYIPIPDASKLKAAKGMFYLSEGPENNRGYTFWIDDVKFENVGTIGNAQASIFKGEDKVINSFTGVNNNVDDIAAIFNLPNGINQTVNVSPYYFTYNSSDPTVATVNDKGVVTTVGAGTSKITASLGNSLAKGSLTINCVGAYLAAPVPTQDASKVISIFSDQYTNVPVDYYNGYYAPYQTTQSADFTVNNDHVLNYTNFNFVGIQFSKPTINASSMTNFHMDIYMPQSLPSGASFSVQLIDWGADGAYGGGDDTSSTKTYSAPFLAGQKWVSIDIPFSSLSGLASRKHLGQIILSGANISNFYTDNVYLYNN